LINVIKVVDFKDMDYVAREMILVKVSAENEKREEVLRLTEIFRGNIVDVSPKTYTVMITGDEEKIRAFLNLLKPFGIKELVRTGPIAIPRGDKIIKIRKEKGDEDG